MHVTIEDKHHVVKQLYPRIGGGFTTKRALSYRKTIGGVKMLLARIWAKKRELVLREVDSPYPFIILDDDTKMPRAKLAKRINKLGRRRKRLIWMGEGWRTRARQQALYNQFVRRNFAPPVVAVPSTSNHETGWAADISVFVYGPKNDYTNVGYDDHCRRIMHATNLCLPVPGERWHTQLGNDWRN